MKSQEAGTKSLGERYYANIQNKGGEATFVSGNTYLKRKQYLEEWCCVMIKRLLEQ